MDALALTLAVVFGAVAFGLRTFVQWRRTGDSGWRVRELGSLPARIARIGMVVGFGLLVLGPLAALTEPGGPGAGVRGLRFVGAVVAAIGIFVAVLAQFGMGRSWRIGVDPDERTDLVTTGWYRWVRNPIYTGILAFALGQALLVMNAWSVLALVIAFAGTEVQVREVEEPYLEATHGAAYREWATRAGRFVPLVGRRRPRGREVRASGGIDAVEPTLVGENVELA
jgi:protein-S-isoprenylcysteine O-methyltransferase Ste14